MEGSEEVYQRVFGRSCCTSYTPGLSNNTVTHAIKTENVRKNLNRNIPRAIGDELELRAFSSFDRRAVAFSSTLESEILLISNGEVSNWEPIMVVRGGDGTRGEDNTKED